MTLSGFTLASLRHYWRTHLAAVLGVAAAVAVLAGSLLVGVSVRRSLEGITTARLGRTINVVATEQPFPDSLASRLEGPLNHPVAPLFSLTGIVRHDVSGARAGNVAVYGVDARFFAFHGVQVDAPQGSRAWLSPDLAAELGAATEDSVVLRVARPTDIPLDSLHGQNEEAGRTIRLTSLGTLTRAQVGDFSLAPGQGPARSIFVSLERLQKDIEQPGQVNTLLVGGGTLGEARAALDAVATAVDVGLKVSSLPNADMLLVESAAGIINDSQATRILQAASERGRSTTPVLTWLANRISIGDRVVPYSLVTALGYDAAGDATLQRLLQTPGTAHPPMVLNEWTARGLGAKVGETIALEYYRWSDEGRLVTERASFTLTGVVPMRGLAVDRRLAPDYPGITTAANVTDWDPPFPIDLRLIRPQDEQYWDEYRTAPKAFIRLAAGQDLWRTRHGQVTSIRVADARPLDLRSFGDSFPAVAVRDQNVAASAGATDFGAYFSYFSFFLMVAALLLTALFFRLSVEQRLPQLGVLRAAGFALPQIRRVLLMEGALIVVAGAVAGIAGAIAWAALMMYALRTWWVGAVGTTLLELHVDPASLAMGAAGAAAAALVSIVLTVRAVGRASPRMLLTGVLPAVSRRARAWVRVAGLGALVLAGVLTALAVARLMPAAGGFFGAGACVLIGGLAVLRDRFARPASATAVPSLRGLAARNAGWRPGRSVTVAGLIAAAVFLLVSVDSFRKRVADADSPASGTGGFAVIGESAIPVVHDLQTPAGRDAAGFPTGEPALADLQIVGLRLRPGDDASCLNLYQPKRPRLLGVPKRLIDEGRFRFARVWSGGAAASNPWTLLDSPLDNNEVPAIVDQTSLQYVLHASVGDVVTIDADTSRPIPLRIVGSLDDSVLQGEIMIGEAAFRRLFPDIGGYRVFLASSRASAAETRDGLAAALESALEPFGFDAQSTVAKLETFHRVENTYLSTFQALGGLGLVLGCVGLVAIIARNILERRRELALLGAAGYTGADLQRVIALEHAGLVIAGLVIGLAAAGLAIAPVLATRSGALPWQALIWLAPVAGAGLLAAFGATRSLRRMPLVASLRAE
jgi:ABC-type antimicrobial peptide transport system permease subunit